MKQIFILCLTILATFSLNKTQAQTADEIIENYLETIGGIEAISAIKSAKSTCSAQAQGMDIPIVMYQAAPGKQKMDMNFQGQQITQMCFDGKEGWSTNFMTMEAERWDAQQSQIAKSQMDFPDSFLNYKDKGYSISLEGEETIEGTECFKVKLHKGAIEVDGKDEEIVSYFFFDKETNVPVMQRDFTLVGEMKGAATETYLSDYDEVEGVYFPHTITQKMNGMEVFSVRIDKIEINVDMGEEMFAFPEKVPADKE